MKLILEQRLKAFQKNIPEDEQGTGRGRSPPGAYVSLTNTQRRRQERKETMERLKREADFVRETIFVPDSMYRRVIGKRGKTIKNIREKSGAQIDVKKPDSDESPAEIDVVGIPAAVELARDMIKALINNVEKEFVQPSQPPQPPQPLDTDEEANEVIQIPASMVGRIIGQKGSTIKKIRQKSGARVALLKADNDESPADIHISGKLRAVKLARDMIELINDAEEECIHPTQELEIDEEVKKVIEVPVSMVGRIIGRRGENIKKIREDSGANIEVGQGSITFRGSTDSVLHAIDLISEFMDGLADDGNVSERKAVPKSASDILLEDGDMAVENLD